MTDTNRPQDAAFETDEVEANHAREQGLGLGARELAAQRDAGPEDFDDDADTDRGVERLKADTAVQGDPDGEDEEGEDGDNI